MESLCKLAYRLAYLTVFAVVVASVPQSAAAQFANCGPRDVVLTRLAKVHDEKPVNLGITSRGELLEIVAAPSGSWTLLITVPGGPTCMVSFGEGWRALEPAADGPLT